MTISTLGKLFIVATPIGNRDDISIRALQVLQSVDLILAEDTRHSKRLLDYHCINTKLRACHEHNEEKLIDSIAAQLKGGLDVALISDAGTPLISDPGFVLVRALREQGLEIVAVPGPSAVIAALSIAGLPTDRFYFAGFLPAKSAARRERYGELGLQTCTTAVLESSHRIKASLEDLAQVLGPQRGIAVARELTKKFETVIVGTVAEVLTKIDADPDQLKGEFVVLIAGAEQSASGHEIDPQRLMRVLLQELPLKKAAKLAAELTGMRKNELYDLGLESK